MTRETKIGLLVGLAFIIVIGILLSDHLTSSTEPPQATLAVAGNNVRSGVSAPGTNGNPPIATSIAPAPVAPRSTVPTQSDLAPRPQPVQPVQVAVGGPSNVQSSTTQIQVRPPVVAQAEQGQTLPQTTTLDQTTDSPNTTAVTDSAPVISKAPPIAPQPPTVEQQTPQQTTSGTDIASALRDAAKQHGEELVTVGGSGSTGATPAGSRQGPAGTKAYVAVEGDSVSKMASKFLGSNTKANRDAIINANPSLKQNVNIVIVGKTYYIPTSATSGGIASATPSPAPAPTPVAQAPVAQVTSSAEAWYTVKEGDSLWKIATEQCGSAAAIQAIRDLNKDTLKGDNVIINTKLRLPNKVASAN